MSDGPQFVYAGRHIPIRAGDTVLTSLCREGIHPRNGGPLCFGGDCPNCVATIDGVSYVRACQTAATDGLAVEPHPDAAQPALSFDPPDSGHVPVTHLHTGTVVIGGGESGRTAAGAVAGDVLVFDAGHDEEVIGLYPGPLVVVRTPEGMRNVNCEEVVVATGASEIQPVVPGSDLAGILTPRAAEHLAAAGVELGRVVAVGDAPDAVEGSLVRFEGEGEVVAVVTATADGEHRHECDTVVVGLGLYPRSGLARMATNAPVSIVGDAAIEPALPACPPEGIVCPCEGVTFGQLEDVWRRGFTEMELVKRATLAGTGTCQGGVCIPYLRSFLLEKGKELQPAFTSRPVARQLTMGEIAADSHLPVFPRTALDQAHRALGAQMDRIGGWWRPWTYGDTEAEYWAVRQRVSIGDVSTLGKMRITGPDAEAALQRIYPTNVASIKPGRSRYVLMLNERGYVFDDGLVCREPGNTFTLTFTSGGASMAEMWIRDWTASWGFDVRILNQTFALGAINVTGPLAKQLLAKAGLIELPSYMGHADVEVA
ncbi:MAG TPA: 2Fe-2S iron-sulfur cluster-binding protein, partial [Acidimicrobiia bacterium]|nr:2Fe-2S iron-sulfur cluster-binding protein [Acidimicrobiia bacterium]